MENDRSAVKNISRIKLKGEIKMELEVEVNENLVQDNAPLKSSIGGTILITPPIGKDYWAMRVKVSEKQAIVCFPKFLTMGIGFQKEEDWNCNLPYTCGAKEIFDHISHNKGDEEISDMVCITAITLLQETIRLNI